MIALTHDHMMYGLAAQRIRGKRAVFSKYYASLFRKGEVNLTGWVVGGDPPFFSIENEDSYSGTSELIDMIWEEAEESSDDLFICLSDSDINNAIEAKKVALVLAIEGGSLLNNLSDLQYFYNRGVRSLQLVGQDWNQLIHANSVHPEPSSGLSDFGKEVILEMNRLGMIIDLAHIPDPDPLFSQILDLSQKPLIDSHRGVCGASNIGRNISDDRVTAIAESGGIVGLQFFSEVLKKPGTERGSIEDLVRHIDQIVKVGGIETVSLGPDFLEFNQNRTDRKMYIEGCENITQIPRIAHALSLAGYSEDHVDKIMGLNYRRFLKDVLG